MNRCKPIFCASGMVFEIDKYIGPDKQLRVPKTVLDISKPHSDRKKREVMHAIDSAIDGGKLTFDRSYLKPLSWEFTRGVFLTLCGFGRADLMNATCGTCGIRSSYAKKFVVLLMVLRHNLHYNAASDLFQRHERMRVEVDGVSPYSLWADPDRISSWLYKVGKFMGRPSAVGLSSYLLRKCMMHKPYATQFPPFTAKGVYVFLGARRVLDPCFGWGDRFAAAYATSSVQAFHGIDPRRTAHKGFIEQRARYGEWLPAKQMVCVFTEGRAEKTKLQAGAYDTIFTSPPFFDKEKYKSIGKFASLEAWFERFLEPMLDNVWQALSVGGHLALHLEDDPKRPISNSMNTYIGQRPGAIYRGIICMPKNERPGIKDRGNNNEPIWVWQKVKVTSMKQHPPAATRRPSF